MTNIDTRCVITSDHDRKILTELIEQKVSPSSWIRIRKLIDANHTRNKALDSRLVLSERNYLFLLTMIGAVGFDYFTKICEFLKEKVGFTTVIESIYTSYKFFGSACDSIFYTKWNHLLDELREENIDKLVLLKQDKFVDYFKRQIRQDIGPTWNDGKLNLDLYIERQNPKLTKNETKLVPGYFGLYFFILRKTYDRIKEEWNEEQKLLFLLLNLLYFGSAEDVQKRITEGHAQFISQAKNRVLPFYSKVKILFPGEQIVALGFIA